MGTLKRLALATAGLVLGASSFLVAQDLLSGGDGGVRKENLDLPYHAGGANLSLYSRTLPSEGFFYVIDRSGSMQDSGELWLAKQEVKRNISKLSEETEFAIIFFDARVLKFPQTERPAVATAASKGAAMSFIASISGGTGGCPLPGLRKALRFADLSNAERKVIVYLGDGGACACGGARSEPEHLHLMVKTVTSENYQGTRIDCVGVGMGDGRKMQRRYMQRLAAANGGTYREID